MSGDTHEADTALRTAILDELRRTPGVDPTHIGVAVNCGAVTLSGEVDSYPEKRLAERAALRAKGVLAVAEEITVRALGEEINDTDIARWAAEELQDSEDVPDTVSAVVHDYVITLTGTATAQHQRVAAARAVRYLPRVIAVHDHIVLEPTHSP